MQIPLWKLHVLSKKVSALKKNKDRNCGRSSKTHFKNYLSISRTFLQCDRKKSIFFFKAETFLHSHTSWNFFLRSIILTCSIHHFASTILNSKILTSDSYYAFRKTPVFRNSKKATRKKKYGRCTALWVHFRRLIGSTD